MAPRTMRARPGATKLYPKQRAAIYDPARFVFIEASTKSGKTVGCILWLIDQAVTRGAPGREFWWVAPIREQAKIAYRRMKRYMRCHDGVPLYGKNDSELALTLPNGARIVCKGSDNPDGLYGEDVEAAVIDEASRCKEDAWHAVRSTLTATRGPARIIGNVKGRKNWAYRLGRRARQGMPGYAYHVITALDAVEAGVLAADEIVDAMATLPPDVFAELYMAVATEDGANPFGHVAIRACVAPMSTAAPVVWGWDLGRKQDWTVGIGLDAAKRVCRMLRFRESWPRTITTILEATGSTKAWVDGTGVGDAIVGQLQAAATHGNYTSFVFTQRSKQQIVEGLSIDIQGRAIAYPEGVLVEELETFEYTHTRTGVVYSAPEGLHDDAVCALAMARGAWVEGGWQAAELW